MADGYTLRKDGYVDGIGGGGEHLKSILNSTDAAAWKISYWRQDWRLAEAS